MLIQVNIGYCYVKLWLHHATQSKIQSGVVGISKGIKIEYCIMCHCKWQ